MSAPDPEALRAFVDGLSAEEVKALLHDWRTWARPNQLTPEGEWWTHWLILAGRGYGKRISVDELLPTPTGFIRNGDVVAGDVLIGSDGGPTTVVAAHPIELATDCYRVEFDDGSAVDADAGHLWTTYTKLARKQENRGKPLYGVTLTTHEMAGTLLYKGRESNHAVAVPRMVGREAELPLNPYALGVWLGDGMSHEPGWVLCGENDAPIFSRLHGLGHSVGAVRWTNPRSANGKSWPIYKLGGMSKGLRSLGVVKNKHIPMSYLRSSVEQRLELLRGLMDTDGSVTRAAGQCELSLSNEQLARDAHHLICSLGIRPTMSSYDSWRYLGGAKFRKGKDRYRISFTWYDDEPVFTLPHKVCRLKKRGKQASRQRYRYVVAVTPIKPMEMRCLTVDALDHLYCVGSSFVLTHNTRTGAETISEWARSGKYGRIALVAEDAGDARDVMVEGSSGIIACSQPWFRPVYEPTKRRLTWPNGAVATIFADSDPEALRGPQHDAAWVDEWCKFSNARDTWSNLMLGLRLGKHPRTIITTTPKPIPLLRELIAREGKDVVITRGTTYENRANLAKSFFTEIITEYEGTSLGRQELLAQLIDPEEAGIVRRSWFRLWNFDHVLPKFHLVIQSYDTAFTEKTQNDPTACTVWGVFEEPAHPGVFSVILLDSWADHLQYPDLRDKVKKEYNSRYGEKEALVDYVLIEEKGSGISLIQDLRLARVPVQAYNPGRPDKVQRLNAVSHLIKNGRVYVPESGVKRGKPVAWAEDWMTEVCSFPLVEHDDYVDSTSQALQLLRDQQWLVVDLFKDTEDEADYSKKRKENPYAQ